MVAAPQALRVVARLLFRIYFAQRAFSVCVLLRFICVLVYHVPRFRLFARAVSVVAFLRVAAALVGEHGKHGFAARAFMACRFIFCDGAHSFSGIPLPYLSSCGAGRRVAR